MQFDYRLSTITFQQIQVFLSAANTLNFTHTANELNMTQPGVSKSISTLEATLGFLLFERNNRRIYLTKEGQILVRKWENLLADLQNGYQEALHANAQDEMILNVGITNTTDSRKYFWPLADIFRQKYPKVTLNVESEDMRVLQNSLADNIYDIIFIPDFEHYNLDRAKLPWKYAARANIQIIVPVDSPLAEQSELTMEEIMEKSVTALDPDTNPNFVRSLKELYAEYGRKPKLGQMYKSNFQIRYAQIGEDCIHITDDFWSYHEDNFSKKIPLKGHFNGVICTWDPHSSKKCLKQFLDIIQVTE